MQELVGKITGSANDAAGQAKGAASDAAGSAKGAASSAQSAGKDVAKKAPVSTLTFALANPAGNAQVRANAILPATYPPCHASQATEAAAGANQLLHNDQSLLVLLCICMLAQALMQCMLFENPRVRKRLTCTPSWTISSMGHTFCIWTQEA